MKPQTLNWTVQFVDGLEQNITIPDEEYDSEDHVTEMIAMMSDRPDEVDDCWPNLMRPYGTTPYDEIIGLRAALNDLWGCIGVSEIAHLQPKTIRVAVENHTIVCHPKVQKVGSDE